MTEIIVLQHAACEGPGTIADALSARGIHARTIRSDLGEQVPSDLGAASGLVAMGGPMGVCEQEQFAFLSRELRLIEKTIHGGLPVLGICLGSQLLAAALGSRVYKGSQKEIGWHSVSVEPGASGDPLFRHLPARLDAFHWHGDIFDLPEGAVALARSERTSCQAFCYEQAYGILFHMEVTQGSIEGMVETFRDELAEAHISGQAILADTVPRLAQLQSIGSEVFREWAAMVTSQAMGLA